jgi:phosphoribosylamine--glycine ligase
LIHLQSHSRQEGFFLSVLRENKCLGIRLYQSQELRSYLGGAMKILLLGSGGREHAMAAHFSQCNHSLICLPGSHAIECLPHTICLPHLSASDPMAVLGAAMQHEVDLVVSGPEAPLAAGVGDVVAKASIPFFGPTVQGVQLESSKVFAKNFMQRHGIPTARYHTCSTLAEAIEILDQCADWAGIVVKPSGLTGGKGVTVCQDREEAAKLLRSYLVEEAYGEASAEVVIEEELKGGELSVFAVCGGGRFTLLPTAQDHKRLLEGDLGPNTGGMGAYAPAPFVDDALLQTIRQQCVEPTMTGLAKEGIDYCGILYFGFMLTEEGPKLLEYNCRLGDPEAQAVLPLLTTDLAQTMLGATRGEETEVLWKQGYGCVVVAASEGYPQKPVTGQTILGLEGAEGVYHAGTRKNQDGSWETAGGRVLGATGVAPTLESAVAAAYSTLDGIKFSGMQVRRDIAARVLVAV